MIYILCIGSNEHQQENLLLARRLLQELFTDIQFSNEEETAPVNCQRQVMFLNQMACFTSHLVPSEITLLLKRIEQEAKRTVEEKKQGIIRLDIDLLANVNPTTETYTVYKPDDWNRDYVQRGLQSLHIK